MRLIVKRTHMPYPNVVLRAGLEMTIEPDEVADALIRRGYFVSGAKPDEPKKSTKKAVTDGKLE